MGRLPFETKSSCGKLISELAAQEPKEAVIDLRDVGFLDSAGLGFLLRAQDALHRKGAQLTLRVPNDGQTKNALHVEILRVDPVRSKIDYITWQRRSAS